MAELENAGQETTEQVETTEIPSLEPVETLPTETETGNEPVNQTTEAKVYNWETDKRYGKMWKSPNDLYKSYRSMEEQYPALKKQLEEEQMSKKTLYELLEKNGFKPETFAEELERIKPYRDENSEINQVYNYWNKWANNDLYKDKIAQFYQELEMQEIQRQYPNMNAEQIKKQMELEKQVQELKTFKQQQEQTKYVEEIKGTIQNSLGEVEKFAGSFGYKLTPEVKNFLLDHCAKNGIDPKYIKSEFFSLYQEELMKARDKKIEGNIKVNKEKQKSGTILNGGSNKNTPPKKMTASEKLESAVKNIFK